MSNARLTGRATATVGLAPTRRNRFGALDIANAAQARRRDGRARPDTSQQVWRARNRQRPAPRHRDGRACPDTWQQVWRARNRQRRASTPPATVGLAPTRRNRFGALFTAAQCALIVLAERCHIGTKLIDRLHGVNECQIVH